MVLLTDSIPALAPTVPPAKPSLAGMSRAELRAALAAAGVPEKQLRMRSGQLWSWIYVRGAPDFDAMTRRLQGTAHAARRTLFA